MTQLWKQSLQAQLETVISELENEYKMKCLFRLALVVYDFQNKKYCSSGFKLDYASLKTALKFEHWTSRSEEELLRSVYESLLAFEWHGFQNSFIIHFAYGSPANQAFYTKFTPRSADLFKKLMQDKQFIRHYAFCVMYPEHTRTLTNTLYAQAGNFHPKLKQHKFSNNTTEHVKGIIRQAIEPEVKKILEPPQQNDSSGCLVM